MGGRTYQALGTKVTVDESGILIHSFLRGQMHVPWSLVDDVATTSATAPTRRRGRVVTVELSDGRSLDLPAPRERAERPDEFSAASRAILFTFEEHRSAAAAEFEDSMPDGFRESLARTVVYRGGLLQGLADRAGFGLLALFAVFGMVGIGGSIHSYERDLPAYRAYSAAGACTAAESATGTGSHAYCKVTDGDVFAPAYDSKSHVDAISVGPVSADGTGWTIVPTQDAFFTEGQPALDPLMSGTAVSYIAANGGKVASLVWNGATFQTWDSPVILHRRDLATLTASVCWTLLFVFLAARSLRRWRFTLPLKLVSAAVGSAFFAAAVIAGSTKDGTQRTSDAWIFGTILGISAGACLAVAIGYRPVVAGARRYMSRRYGGNAWTSID